VAGGQTSSLHAHLRSTHPSKSSKSCATETIASFVAPRQRSDYRKEKITMAIGKLIVGFGEFKLLNLLLLLSRLFIKRKIAKCRLIDVL